MVREMGAKLLQQGRATDRVDGIPGWRATSSGRGWKWITGCTVWDSCDCQGQLSVLKPQVRWFEGQGRPGALSFTDTIHANVIYENLSSSIQ